MLLIRFSLEWNNIKGSILNMLSSLITLTNKVNKIDRLDFCCTVYIYRWCLDKNKATIPQNPVHMWEYSSSQKYAMSEILNVKGGRVRFKKWCEFGQRKSNNMMMLHKKREFIRSLKNLSCFSLLDRIRLSQHGALHENLTKRNLLFYKWNYIH